MALVAQSSDAAVARGVATRPGGAVLRIEGAGRVASEERAPARRTILVIEDSEPIRRILGLLLEGHGYEVVAVEAGREGLDAAQRLQPCAISLDLSLPDVDGREVLRALQADPRTQAIPVIVVSAYASTLSPAERASAAEVLSKPFDVDELLSGVARVVS
ncbi:MAG TPA: response regulator [Chloroflexota bacterium]|nr:response regulator [Chloroflexota bacterium]